MNGISLFPSAPQSNPGKEIIYYDYFRKGPGKFILSKGSFIVHTIIKNQLLRLHCKTQ